ncbi:ImuA family protein [Chryseosolibacter indicus]|uniref:Error-prone repair protein ImuA n=1 Tax=Chryseosolibacter indicus TaxID=2782351 RepID=A0ABS5VKH0_9BACT|nr:Error-prone repair protein ImuA [Chryseosolibacter indicus]MBT1701943.1 Error-prone repair protein ImuA [Chryseosolibacter indicus]
MILNRKADILTELQSDILRLQGFRTVNNGLLDADLGVIKQAFPNASFPLSCIHEFITSQQEHRAATNGFLSGLLSSLLGVDGVLLWIGTSRYLFPPSLPAFNLSPERIIFIDVSKQRDVHWVMEEALKCKALTAVVAEVKEISFIESRRFQLAAEQNKVTGFLLCHQTKKISATACASRWKVSPLPSETIDDLPGVGSPKWHVELMKVRNGKPQSWDIQWVDGKFVPIYKTVSLFTEQNQKAG